MFSRFTHIHGAATAWDGVHLDVSRSEAGSGGSGSGGSGGETGSHTRGTRGLEL